MGDQRRELYLTDEIDRLQDEKIKSLSDSRSERGAAKAAIVDHFLSLDKKQKVLESELDKLKEEDL